MAKFSKEVKIGLTVVVALFIFGWGVNYLKGKDIFVRGYKVHGVYSRIDGLTEASPIFYKGFRIGSVRKISLLTNGSNNLLVTMMIEKDIDFPKNTVAQIYSLDLMGSKGIRFLYGDEKQWLESGDTIKTSVTGDLANQMSQEFLPLKDKVENMVVGLDSVLNNFNSVLNTENKESLASGIKSFAGMMKNLNEMTYAINHSLKKEGALDNTLANLDSLTIILKDNGEVLSNMMLNLKDVSGQLADVQIDSLSGRMNSALLSVNSILGSLNDGNGTMGKLLSDERLYDNLNDVSVSLDRLLNDVRVQPKRYVNFSVVSFGAGKAPVPKDSASVFKVLLRKSKYPLDLRDRVVLDSLRVNEERDRKYYLYTLGEEEDYNKILELKKRVVDLYPEAEVVEISNGRMSKK